MAGEHTLNLWTESRPTPEQLEILKAAKRNLDLDILVKPARAIPGSGRVLSFEGRPPFFCEWAETSWDDPKLGAKLRWVLTGEGGRPHTGLEWMAQIIPGIRQLPDVEHEGKVAFK